MLPRLELTDAYAACLQNEIQMLLLQKSGCNYRGGNKMSNLIDLWLARSAQVGRFYLLSNIAVEFKLIMSAFTP